MNRVLGGILIAIGILVAGLSGLCSLVLLVSTVSSMSASELLEGLPSVLIFGGIPFLIGLAAIWGGRVLLRSNEAAVPSAGATSDEGDVPPRTTLDDQP